MDIRDALRDLVPFVKFQKRKKRPWRSVKLLVILLHRCFARFLYCKNGTKSRKASHMLLYHIGNLFHCFAIHSRLVKKYILVFRVLLQFVLCNAKICFPNRSK